jgi:hypothetical protein
LAKVHQKEKLKWSDFGGFNHQKWWENFNKDCQILIFGFQCAAKNIKRTIKDWFFIAIFG